MKRIISTILIAVTVVSAGLVTQTAAYTKDNTTQQSAVDKMINDKYNVVSEHEVCVRYDDRFSVDYYAKGYSIDGFFQDEVTSYKVQYGNKLDSFDDAVVTYSKSGECVATGVGKGKLVLVNKNNPTYTNSKADAVVLDVTVQKAPLTVVYIAGQSNAEGHNSTTIPFTPEDSIVCPLGQVYSTYAPSNKRGAQITGISGYVSCTPDTAPDYVAGALGNDYDYSINNKKLAYGIDSLTENGDGKSGLDSGFAYELNRLTNNKIWLINSAAGDTSVTQWQKGGVAYERAIAVFTQAKKTLDAEIASNHYELDKTLCLWLQGEKDKQMVFSEYYSKFVNTINLLDTALNLDCFGIISNRSALSHTTQKDMSLTAPRLAQTMVANSNEFDEVYMLSMAHEFWGSDNSVKEYFSTRYPNGYLTYPLRSNANISKAPVCVNDVHFDVHFTQRGHNENGIDAARNFYSLCNNTDESVSFYWLARFGNVIDTTHELDKMEPFKMALRVYPPHKGKEYKIEVDESYLGFDYEEGKYVPQRAGYTTVSVLDKNMQVVNSISVHIPCPDGYYILADVDADDEISVLDATEIQMVVADKKDDKDNKKAIAGDVDRDSELTVLDATAIQLHLAQKVNNDLIGQMYKYS